MQTDYTTQYIKRALDGGELSPPTPNSKEYNVLESLFISWKMGGSEAVQQNWNEVIEKRPDLKAYGNGGGDGGKGGGGATLGDDDKHQPDDDEIALLMADEWAHQYSFFHSEWRYYENGVWNIRQQPEIQTAVRQFLRRFRKQGVKVSQSRIKAITSMLMDDVFIPDRDVIEAAPERKKYIPLRNGLYNVDDMKLEAHKPEFYFTNQLSFEFDPFAKCPAFIRFLESSLVVPGTKASDDEMIMFVQEALAYSMTARTDLKASFWLYGKPDSGKSTLLSFIRSLMGDLHATIDLNTLGGNRFMLGGIVGKRVVTFSEADQGVMLPDGLYKALVGGTDEVFADVKNKPAVVFQPESKLWWAMNNAPRTTDRSGAVVNRLKPVLFNRSIPKSERIKDLDRILAGEVAGVFNWLLIGYRRLLENGRFTEPIEATRWLEDYKLREDTELSFYTEMMKTDANATVQSSELYASYRNWCERNGFKAKNINQFSLEAERLGLQKFVRNGRRFWKGAELLEM